MTVAGIAGVVAGLLVLALGGVCLVLLVVYELRLGRRFDAPAETPPSDELDELGRDRLGYSRRPDKRGRR